MKSPATPDRDTFLVAQIATLISVAAFFYFVRHDELVLYGDAVAHMNIARRVFDSRTPGPLQLGTVWLPLPHLLMLPFLVPRWLWQTGIGGSFPSMVAYILSDVGIFRLVRTVLPQPQDDRGRAEVRFTAWVSVVIFALNPNLIYLQATAMTESLYVACLIWAVVFFASGLRCCQSGETDRGNGALVKASLCLAAASWTRYDGWLLTAVMVVLAIVLALFGNFAPLRSGAIQMALIASVAPALWLAYNAAVYHNPLEFANGPYSARAIEQKTAVSGFPPHPGSGDLRTAFHYFFKSAQLNLAAGGTFERNQGTVTGVLQALWVSLLLFGTAVVVLFQRRLWPVLLLWIPVPFYMLSIAYSGVPVFIPVWWPFSYYNVRYGIEFLPAFATLVAFAAYGLMRFFAGTKRTIAIGAWFLLMTAITYTRTSTSGIVSLQEAQVNARTRIALEKQLASIFATWPSDSTYLMYLGDHPGAFQRAGIPLSRVINEGNHRPWERPSDPEGLWEKALAHPASYADYVVALDSDAVAASVNKGELEALLVLHVTGQPEAIIYRTRKSNQAR